MKHRNQRILQAVFVVATTVVAAGCASDPVTAPPVTTVIEAKLSSIQTNIFTPTCAVSGCHAGNAPQAGLNLEAGNSRAQLIAVVSTQVSTLKRVTPGDPNNSYIVDKIEGSARMALNTSRMPQGGSALSAEKITAIRNWIAAGAKND